MTQTKNTPSRATHSMDKPIPFGGWVVDNTVYKYIKIYKSPQFIQKKAPE